MGFTFVETGSRAAIRCDGQDILRLERNLHFFRCRFWARDQVMLAGGRVEVASVPTFNGFGSAGEVTDVRYAATEAADSLTLTITPTRTDGGADVFSKVREQVTFRVTRSGDRLVWRQGYRFETLCDLDPAGDAYRFYRMPRPDGMPGCYVQFADPQPANASGPAVPMTRDWLEHYEPYVGPDTFRQHWKRDYVGIVFENEDGSFSHSDLNKTKWHHLTVDNRLARACRASGVLYVVRDDGHALEYRYTAPSHYHHVCEWGMDFHFWADVEPFMVNGVIPAGTVIEATTEARLVGPETVGAVVAKARPIELTPRERELADLPAYEEPENTFTVGALERMDAQPWAPSGEGCVWERRGGYGKGRGSLVIHNHVAVDAQWVQDLLGPSQWGNPFVPGARYRFSAWVRMDELVQEPNWPSPMIGAEFTHYSGPAANGGGCAPVHAGWSALTVTADMIRAGRVPWTYLELITRPCPGYVLRGALRLRLFGRGTAYFSNVRWELIG